MINTLYNNNTPKKKTQITNNSRCNREATSIEQFQTITYIVWIFNLNPHTHPIFDIVFDAHSSFQKTHNWYTSTSHYG